jgi:hypothetical protein
MRLFTLTAAAVALVSAGAVAAPTRSTSAPTTNTTDTTSSGFVCPVISTDNVLHSPKGGTLSGGDYTIGGPDVSVPTHATNGDGTGSPQGTHSSPGDTNYSAIWSLSIDTC